MSNNLPAVIDAAMNLQKIENTEINLILPSKSYGAALGKYDKVIIEVIKIDPIPENGEVFEINKKLSLCKPALDKIGNALHIKWDPQLTGIIESTPNKSRAKAVGRLSMPNGDIITMVEEKTVDLEAFEEEQRIVLEEKAIKGNYTLGPTKWGTTKSGKKYPLEFPAWKNEKEKTDIINLAVRKAMIQYRKFKDERAMTGARERCIKAIIALKSSYTAQELSLPFAFPIVTLDTSKMLEDEDMRDIAIEKMTGATHKIFKNKQEKEEHVKIEDAEIITNESDQTDIPDNSIDFPEMKKEEEEEEEEEEKETDKDWSKEDYKKEDNEKEDIEKEDY